MSERLQKQQQTLLQAKLRFQAVDGRQRELAARLAAADKNIEVLDAQLAQGKAEKEATQRTAETIGDRRAAASAAVEAHTALHDAIELGDTIGVLELQIEREVAAGASQARLDQLGDNLREARRGLVDDAAREAIDVAARKADERIAALDAEEERLRKVADLERGKAAASRNAEALAEAAKDATQRAKTAKEEIARLDAEILALQPKVEPPKPPPAGGNPAPGPAPGGP